MFIGRILKGLREAKGWTYEEAARHAHMRPSTWWNLEKDNRQGLTVDTLSKLAQAFSMAGSDLLELVEISETQKENSL